MVIKFKSVFVPLGIILIVNLLAFLVYFRIDFTKEKRFTINDKTKQILQNNKNEILVTVFLEGEMPSAFKRLRNAAGDLLNDLKAYGKGNVKIEFIDPLYNLSVSQRDTTLKTLIELGIKPTNINIKTDVGFSQKMVFPMALIESDGKRMPVKLLQNLGGNASDYQETINNAIQNLEYIFASSIKKVIEGYNAHIGFTEGNGEPKNAYLYDAISSLADSYVVGRINLNEITKEGLDSMKMLVIDKPTKPFTEAQKYKINYFVMKGGTVIWALDQVKIELDSLGDGNPYLATNRALNLDDMLFEYGARINYNLLADINCAEIPISIRQQGIQFAPWLYYPILMPDTSVNLVKNLDGILSKFPGTVDTIGVADVTKKMILFTSPYNKTYNTPKILSLQMIEQEPDIKEFTARPKAVGVLLEGKFKSVFVNRPIPENIDENFNPPPQSKPTKMLVVGDGDLFLNQLNSADGSPYPLGFDHYGQRNFGNKTLLLNVADYFTSNNNLIELRNKIVKIRLLDKTKKTQQKLKWQLVNLIIPVFVLICFAIFQHYYRKYKYAK